MIRFRAVLISVITMLMCYVTFSQSSDCEAILTQKIKIIKSNHVKHKGQDLEKGQTINLSYEIPLKTDKMFFECNQLEFSKGGELQFYDTQKKAVRFLRYIDYLGSSRTFQSESLSNAVSRDDDNASLNYCDESGILNLDFHLSNLLENNIHICDFDCLQIFFNHQNYIQLTQDTLTFNRDDFYIKGLLFQMSDGQEQRFLKQDNKIIINSEVLPEEDEINLFIIGMDGSASSLATYNYINLDKIIARLKKNNLKTKDIESIIHQVYLNPYRVEITQTKTKERLKENLKKIISQK